MGKRSASIYRDIAGHFHKVLDAAIDAGLAPSGLVSPFVWMAFDGRSAEYHCIDWDPFVDRAWHKIRQHLAGSLPLEVHDVDYNGAARPSSGLDAQSVAGHALSRQARSSSSPAMADTVDFWTLSASELLEALAD